MTNEELRKLQMTILIIADEIKRVCEKNHIRFGIGYGTLIGAVRHKGFIPWDDDFDIDMLREEYEKFIKVCETDLGSEFILQTWNNDSHYPKGFCKILLKGTNVLEKETVNTKYQKGIYVDIFPWDNVPNNHLLEKKQEFEVYFYKKLLHIKENISFPSNSNLWKKAVFYGLKLIGKLFSRETLVRANSRALQRYNNTDYVSCMVGVYGYQKLKFHRSIFDELIDMTFEDRVYPGVKNYDIMLTQVYGDYMKLPPLEKRRTHELIELDFGTY